jgi:hypothetical protein
MKHGLLRGALLLLAVFFASANVCFSRAEIQAGIGPSFPAVNMTDHYSTVGADASFRIVAPTSDKWAIAFQYAINGFFSNNSPDNLHSIAVCVERRGKASPSGALPYSVLGLGYVASPRAIYDGLSFIGGFGVRIPLRKITSLFIEGNVVIGGPAGAHEDTFVFFPLVVGLNFHGTGTGREKHEGPIW